MLVVNEDINNISFIICMCVSNKCLRSVLKNCMKKKRFQRDREKILFLKESKERKYRRAIDKRFNYSSTLL